MKVLIRVTMNNKIILESLSTRYFLHDSHLDGLLRRFIHIHTFFSFILLTFTFYFLSESTLSDRSDFVPLVKK